MNDIVKDGWNKIDRGELKTPEEKLIHTTGMDKLTDEESDYLERLLPKVTLDIPKPGQISPKRARQLFDKRFPNSEWRWVKNE